jgi:aldose 1-epimerase
MAAAAVLFGCGSGSPPARHAAGAPAPADQADDTEDVLAEEFQMSVQSEPLGETPGGEPIQGYFLTNRNGLRVTVIDYGAIITSVHVPDRDDQFENVTLGFPAYEGYFENAPYFGAVCGRYANRIAGGKFTLDGTEYQLATNNPPNHLHGGVRGFNHRVWTAKPNQTEEAVSVELSYTSPDGEEGYPGTVQATVVYSLTKDDELKMEYTATTDKSTPINLTNHCYWNLAGEGTVLEHDLTLNCDKYLPVDATAIPTGDLADVQGTPMDFRESLPIGAHIDQVEGGYDHCYVVRDWDRSLKLAARVFHVESGRGMEVYTTEPGVQLYTGNFLDGTERSGGHEKHAGFCLECQHFPDSPNRPEFPNTILKPGETYKQTTVHKFAVVE